MSIELDGQQLAITDQGQGPPVLLVHAFLLGRAMWAAQVEALAAAGYRAIAPDLPGFGDSPPPARPASLMDQAALLLALLDRLGLERATLVGLSMGGYIAFRLLERAPERLRALVLADTRAGADSPEAAALRHQRAARAEHEGVPEVVKAVLPGMFAGGTLERTDPLLVERVRGMMLAAGPEAVAGALRAMAERPDSTAALPMIACPTLVICGVDDTLTPASEATLMAESIPAARLVLIREAGHLSNLERPDDFNRALLAFLEELPA